MRTATSRPSTRSPLTPRRIAMAIPARTCIETRDTSSPARTTPGLRQCRFHRRRRRRRPNRAPSTYTGSPAGDTRKSTPKRPTLPGSWANKYDTVKVSAIRASIISQQQSILPKGFLQDSACPGGPEIGSVSNLFLLSPFVSCWKETGRYPPGPIRFGRGGCGVLPRAPAPTPGQVPDRNPGSPPPTRSPAGHTTYCPE